MNHANAKTSPRLQRVIKLMIDGRERTTRQIIRQAHVCSVNAIFPELRRNGIDYTCKRRGDKWYYRMVI